MTVLTEEQLLIDVAAGMSGHAIARKYGMTPGNINRRIKRLGARGLGHGGNVSRFVPDGYKVKGTSSLVKEDGTVALQWVKTDVDAERQLKMMQEAIVALTECLSPLEEINLISRDEDSTLLNMYTVTDAHIGMLACEEEGGDDYDTNIAEHLISSWFKSATTLAPNATECLINLQGDFLHFDGLKAVTPTSGHILDSDTRFFKVVQTAIRVIKRAVNMCLEKHRKVTLLIATGNHDLASAVWLREMFKEVYSGNPRVTIVDEQSPYYAIEFGKVMIGVHHGHCSRMEKLDAVFASKFREIYGRTKFGYLHMGHYHHRKVAESNMFITEMHQTLAAKDEYSSNGGYDSGRSATVITYHRNYGEIGRISIPVEMIKDQYGLEGKGE